MATLPYDEDIPDYGQVSLPTIQYDDPVQQLYDVRREQARSLAEHAQYREKLVQAQDQVNARSQDLDVAERMNFILDTNVPKPMRMYQFRKLAQYLGSDPKGDEVKELSKVVTGLDPDSAQAARSAFVERVKGATPGQVAEFARGILRGKVDIMQLAGMVRTAQVGQTETMTDASPPGSPVPEEQGAGRFASPQLSQAQVPGAAPESTPTLPPPNARSLPQDNRVVDPAVAVALGYDPNTSSSAEILEKHPGIGSLDSMGAEQRNKLISELQTSRIYTKEAMILGKRITDILDQDPNAAPSQSILNLLPIVGGLSEKYVNSKGDFNMAAWRVSSGDALRQILAAKGLKLEDLKTIDPQEAEQVRATARRYVDISNTLISLAYASAKAKDPSGRLSDQDIAIELRGLAANSGSADLFKEGINTYVDNTIQRYNIRTQVHTGGNPAPVETPGLVALNSARIVGQPEQAGGAGGAGGGGTPSAVPGQQSQAIPTDPSARQPAQPSGPVTPTQQAQQARTRQEAKQADEEVQQQTRKMQLEELPREYARRAEAAQRDAQRLELAIQQAKELKEWREYQKLKDEQRQKQQEADRIRKAFEAFAARLSRIGGSSVSLIPSPGGEQDANAFKLAPRPQRQAPSPGPAVSGFENYNRSRKAR